MNESVYKQLLHNSQFIKHWAPLKNNQGLRPKCKFLHYKLELCIQESLIFIGWMCKIINLHLQWILNSKNKPHENIYIKNYELDPVRVLTAILEFKYRKA